MFDLNCTQAKRDSSNSVAMGAIQVEDTSEGISMLKQLFVLSFSSLAFFGCNPEERSPLVNPSPGVVEQGETEPDRNVTQEIRQSLMKDNSLSLQSKNVVIITQNGIVTIKGTVPNEAEKKSIEEHAKKAPGVKSINNQLIIIEAIRKEEQ